MSLKNPMTPLGIDPGTVRLVAQRLNHYVTPGPTYLTEYLTKILKQVNVVRSLCRVYLYVLFAKLFKTRPSLLWDVMLVPRREKVSTIRRRKLEVAQWNYMEFNIGVCTKSCKWNSLYLTSMKNKKMYIKFYLRIKIIPITRLQTEKTVIPKYEKIKVLLLLLLLYLITYNFSCYSAGLVTWNNCIVFALCFPVYNLFLCISAYYVIGY